MTMRLPIVRAILVACSVAMLVQSHSSGGEKKKDPAAEAEAAQAAEEDAAEAKMDPEKLRRMFEGKLTLFPVVDGQEPQVVIGTLAGKNFNYLIKIENDSLRGELKEYHNKEVLLVGKVRNQGKYLIVSSIMRGGAAPVFVRRKGGI